MSVLLTLFAVFRSLLRSRAALELENLALRHQVNILKRSVKRPRLRPADRWLWVVLARVWKEWQSALAIVQPATVIAWHRKGFRLFWTWKIRRGKAGRPAVPREVRDLIRRMSRENPLFGREHLFVCVGDKAGSLELSTCGSPRQAPPHATRVGTT
jgi:putative transposase